MTELSTPTSLTRRTRSCARTRRSSRAIFKPLSAMPADLRAHLRYPGRSVSSADVAVRHVSHGRPGRVLPSRGSVAVSRGRSRARLTRTPFMRHIIMRLPGEAKPEFIYMTPFTPRGKDNLAAWMVARMDGANYGKLRRVSVPEAESRVRPEADREPHQPGHRASRASSRCGTSAARR